jgi:hypothetical protein
VLNCWCCPFKFQKDIMGYSTQMYLFEGLGMFFISGRHWHSMKNSHGVHHDTLLFWSRRRGFDSYQLRRTKRAFSAVGDLK